MSNLTISVKGSVLLNNNGVDTDVVIMGDLFNSEQQDTQLIERIGVDVICNTVSNDEILLNYEIDELIEFILNDSEFDNEELNKLTLALVTRQLNELSS